MPKLKNTLFSVLDKVRLTQLNMTGLQNFAAILTFHHVSPGRFGKIISHLSKHYNVLPLSGLLDLVFLNKPVPSGMLSRPGRPFLAITFDDGYKNTFEQAYPVLKKHNLHATVFLITDLINSDSFLPAWWDVIEAAFILSRSSPEWRGLLRDEASRAGIKPVVSNHVEFSDMLKTLPPEKRAEIVDNLRNRLESSGIPSHIERNFRFASWSDVSRCSDVFDYGSHTSSHPLLDQLPFREQLRQLKLSSETIKKKTGMKPEILCYPNGNFNSDTIRAAKTAGYRYAVTTRIGWLPLAPTSRRKNAKPNPLAVPRISINPADSLAVAKAKINGVFYKLKKLSKKPEKDDKSHGVD
ncbi:polysaccharide deacetylase family protein [Candidatus Woesearchaeota archaeon]|nr:MAG: polysaccharide deacetylase family protein [Candidatus Woesearchaeota archaeon]